MISQLKRQEARGQLPVASSVQVVDFSGLSPVQEHAICDLQIVLNRVMVRLSGLLDGHRGPSKNTGRPSAVSGLARMSRIQGMMPGTCEAFQGNACCECECARTKRRGGCQMCARKVRTMVAQTRLQKGISSKCWCFTPDLRLRKP